MWDRSVVTRRHLAVGLQPVGQGPPPHDDEPARSSGGQGWAAGSGPVQGPGDLAPEGTAPRRCVRGTRACRSVGSGAGGTTGVAPAEHDVMPEEHGRTLRALRRGRSAPLREQAGSGLTARNKSRERPRSTRRI